MSAAESTDLRAADFTARLGQIFAVFDATTQDSGNVSYGVKVGGERFFVKTAGSPDDGRPVLAHRDRVDLLRNAARIARSLTHEAVPALIRVVEALDGPLLVYTWVEGELLHVRGPQRADPASAFSRFRALPAQELIAALDPVFRVHVALAGAGWIASDFYDGCLVHDFAGHRTHVVDLDHYQQGPFRNTRGRMFGSSRFVAPEELELGALIDEKTTVFNLGRTLEQLFPSAPGRVAQVARRACDPEPGRRFESVRRFYAAWSSAIQGEDGRGARA